MLIILTLGKQTTYFNREISEYDKAIIGDITPKKITSENDLNDNTPRLISSSKREKGASIWNAAGTFEEKSVIDWTSLRFKKLVKALQISIPQQECGNICKSCKVLDYRA